ncbi:hypothetical protein ABAC402_14080 [Asticcacaulis sp. AC402]|nr:hypothetical protein ABAC402_14080 [Asticcacaulis sp. AC402]
MANGPPSHQGPESRFSDANGVNLIIGKYERNDSFLTIGDPATGGLQWAFFGKPMLDTYMGRVISYPNQWCRYNNGSYIFDDETWQAVYSPGSSTCVQGPRIYEVSFGGGGSKFKAGAGGTYLRKTTAQIDTLVNIGSDWVYDNGNGTKYTYTDVNAVQNASQRLEARLTSITYPNGVAINITYESGPCNSCFDPVLIYRVNTVTSNVGYGLKYEYDSANFYKMSAVRAFNTMVTSCDSNYSNPGCNPVSSITFNYLSNESILEVRDALNGATQYKNDNNNIWDTDEISYVKRPNGEEITLNYDIYGRVNTLIDSRGTWTYKYRELTYNDITGKTNRQNSVKDPNNQVIYSTNVFKDVGLPQNFKAPGKTLIYTVYKSLAMGPTDSPWGRLSSATEEEGNKEDYTHDSRGNITTVTYRPKPGSTESIRTTQTNYVTTCTTTVTCNKPTWIRDAKGNQTDYTYDSVHGGVLTTTLPADQNALRLRTYNTYEAFNTGAGTIYRMVRTESCGLSAGLLTLPACPATTGTAVTTISYGTATTAPKTYKTLLPYSVTQTDGANSQALTTAFEYDDWGNIAVVDGPRTDVDDRAYKIHDANRRLVCEISPDPDGTGPLIRSVVRHTYDAANQETLTEVGIGSSTTTCSGVNMTVSSFTRRTYDLAGRVIKTEVGQP